jgi:hypothetical protein
LKSWSNDGKLITDRLGDCAVAEYTFVGAVVWSTASRPVFEPSDVDGVLDLGIGWVCVTDFFSVVEPPPSASPSPDPFLFVRDGAVAAALLTNVASSNGLHLKSFLYPPHVTFLLWHC